MNQKNLEEAERLAIDIAAPLPAIMTLVAADEQLNLPAIMTLLQDVDTKAADLCEVLSRLQQEAEPPLKAVAE